VPKRYPVRLALEEREQLEQLLASGTAATRTLTHARILLKVDEGEAGPNWKNAAIAEALEVSALTVTRVRKRYVEGGLQAALHRKEQERRKARRLDGAQEAHLIALVCSEPPAGRAQWPLRLLAEKMVALGHVEELSHETVRQVLKRGSSNLG
jgi:transposase